MASLPTYIVAGSFNPFHLGHKFLIDAALTMNHSKVVVLQASSHGKPAPVNTTGVLRDIFKERVEVATLPPNTLLAEFAVGNYDNPVNVRGYRNPTDQSYEATLAAVNYGMGLPTQLLPTTPELQNCSSFIRSVVGPGNVGFHNLIRHLMPRPAYTAYMETWIVEHLVKVGITARDSREVLCRYRESHRHYHTLCHLVHVYQELNRLRAVGMGISADVDLAVLFHDAVYDPTATNNEQASVDLLKKSSVFGYGLAPTLILSTASHIPSGRNEEIMVACDLAILGRPAAEYDRYRREIRKEYSFVSDGLYRTERLKVLRNLLDYRFPSYWPDPAYNGRLVTNLKAEIENLNTCALLTLPKHFHQDHLLEEGRMQA